MGFDPTCSAIDSPARNFIVLASSGATFSADHYCKAIIAWTTGSVAVVSVGGSTGSATVNAAPFVIPVQCSAITSVTGTMWALYD